MIQMIDKPLLWQHYVYIDEDFFFFFFFLRVTWGELTEIYMSITPQLYLSVIACNSGTQMRVRDSSVIDNPFNDGFWTNISIFFFR